MRPTSLLSILLTSLVLWAQPAPAARPKTPPAASTPVAASEARRAAIVKFCRKNKGRKVGDGQCWSLANEAFKATGARRVKGQLRVWGPEVNLRKESPRPGDILECDKTRFSDGSYTSGQHTAVIIEVYSRTMVRIAEQNMGGALRVSERNLDLSGVRSGRIFVYRPQ